MGVYVAIGVAAGALPTLPEKTCALSGCFTASANTLSSDTSAVALDVLKSAVVGRVSQAPPWWCWMEMFSSSFPASADSAALRSTVMVMGFSSGESLIKIHYIILGLYDFFCIIRMDCFWHTTTITKRFYRQKKTFC